MLCKRAVSLKSKENINESCVRSAFCYGTECWALKKSCKTTKMKMLHMIFGETLGDGISSEAIREIVGVDKIEEFLREQKLRWFGRIERMNYERAPVKPKMLLSMV